MRTTTLLLASVILLLSSCGKTTGNYSIDGNVSSIANVGTVTLSTFNDSGSISPLVHCAVENGRFCINGTADECKAAYVSCIISGKEVGSILFIENGKIEVSLDTLTCRIGGTPLNELHNAVEDSIAFYIARLDNIEKQYYDRGKSETELMQLAVQGLALQEALVGYLRRTIEENVVNPFGLYMLVVYDGLFSDAELRSLIARIPTATTHSGITPFYNMLLTIAENRAQK